MKYSLFLLPLLVASMGIPAHGEVFKSLFNGKDLTGWSGKTDHWSVEGGMIKGETTKENPT